MSLHVLADHMASKGRNGDSMLVHMTPGEVAGLHALALKHGGSLTINPDTGLPEASFLKSLLPMIAGFALGPAGFGLVSSGLTAGALVGGVTSLATGSLSKGLMAGLGAYGGFGLGEGLLGAGGQELAASGTPIAENIASTAGASVPPIEQINPSNFGFSNADKLSAGIQGLGTETGRASLLANMGGAKGALTTAGMAAAPIMADMMVPTTTKMPTNTNPAYIRQYVTGDRPQAPRALAPVLASDWGSRSFQDAYRGANGGIVALANGGAIRMAGGTPPEMLTDEQLYQKTGSWEAAAAARDEQNKALNEYNWNQQLNAPPVAAAVPLNSFGDSVKAVLADQNGGGGGGAPVDYNQVAADYVKTAAIPTETAGQFISGAEKAGIGLTAPLQLALANSGLSAAAQYALTHADIGMKENTAENYGGLAGLSSNINYGIDTLRKAGTTGAEARAAALAEMNRYGINEADVVRATGKTLAELFPDQIKKVTQVLTGGTGGTGTGGVGGPPTTTLLPTNPQTNAPPGTTNPYGNVNNPGDLTFNPDGTVTVQPNIPGRPYGGFSGIEELTNAYTAGGGSTGYVSPVVKTAAEHDATYNKQTADSLDAYNYLIGKAGAKYPSKSRASEIMKPYEEAVLGYPSDITKKKYINVNGKMVLNPEYKAPQTQAQKTAAATAAAKLGKASTIEVTDSSGETSQTYTAVLQDDGTYLAGNGKKYDVTGKELAAGGGMMGYAVGGGLGSLGSYSDGGRLLKGPGDGVSDSIPATIGRKQQPARLADGEFVVPARIVSELGNGSTDAGARKLYAMMDRVQKARGKTTGKKRVATNTRADKYLPA